MTQSGHARLWKRAIKLVADEDRVGSNKRLNFPSLSEEIRQRAERRLGEMIGPAAESVGTRGSKTKGARVDDKPTLADAADHHSRSLCRTPDEANAEDEHADCQYHCANIGQTDEPVWGPSGGRHDGRNQNCGDRDRTSHKPFHRI